MIPDRMVSEKELADKGFAHKAARMLKPPVSMFGIPAMRKLAREITTWIDEDCYKHMVAYAGLTPPLLPEDLSHNDGLRFEQARVLKELGLKYDEKQWVDASGLFISSGEIIIRLCSEALTYDGRACSKSLGEIADLEEKAYSMLLPAKT